MTTDLQIQISSGTIYGDILRDSGISLPHGKYITTGDMTSQLFDNGMGISKQSLVRDIRTTNANAYGVRDDIWSRVHSMRFYVSNQWEEVMTFNPWKEIMIGSENRIPLNSEYLYEILKQNPKAGTERFQRIFALFTQLNKSYQDQFFKEVDKHSCDLHDQMYIHEPFPPAISHPLRSIFINRMRKKCA